MRGLNGQNTAHSDAVAVQAQIFDNKYYVAIYANPRKKAYFCPG